MTVAELIDHLEKVPQSAKIYFDPGNDHYNSEVTGLVLSTDLLENPVVTDVILTGELETSTGRLNLLRKYIVEQKLSASHDSG